MNWWELETEQRGVSEIYGTVLIISLVLVTALVLVGVGLVTTQELTSDTNDDLARQSIVEMDDRLEELTQSSVESSTTMTFPEDTGSDIKAKQTAGEVEIRVRTKDDDWEATDPNGDLVDAGPLQKSTETLNLGSIVHEGGNGVETAYQGGAVWQKEDGHVSMVSEPNVDIVDDSLQLSFVDLSDVELIQEGEEITFTRDAESSETESNRLTETIREHMTRDGNVVAEAEVTIEITSEYARGWRDYALNGMTDDLNPSRVHMPDDETVVIEFGTYGDSLANVPEAPAGFDEDIIYTGDSQFAPDLYQEDEGTLTDGSFIVDEVKDPDGADPADDKYGVAIRYEHADRGYEWWTWDESRGTNGMWVSLEEPDPDARAIGPDVPDVVSATPSGDRFEVADETWTCVVGGVDNPVEDMRGYIPDDEGYDGSTDTNGCLEVPVDIENPADHTAGYDPFYDIKSFDTTVYDEDGNVKTGKDLVAGEDELEIEVTAENVGSGDGERPVAVLMSAGWSSGGAAWEPWIEGGESDFSLTRTSENTFTMTVQPDAKTLSRFWDDNGKFEIGAGTPHDGVSDGNRAEFKVVDSGSEVTFRLDSIEDVSYDPDSGSHDYVTEGKGTVEVTAKFWNDADESGTRTVMLVTSDGQIKDSKSLTLDAQSGANPSDTVTFEWETIIGDADLSDDVMIKIGNSEAASFDADIRDSVTDAAEFDVTQDPEIVNEDPENINEGDDVSVETTVENVGGTQGDQTIFLKQQVEGGQDEILDWVEVTDVTAGGTENVEFIWETGLGDKGDHTLVVDTGSDQRTMDVSIDRELTESDFSVEILRANSSVILGEDVEVEVEVTNEGDEADTQQVWLDGFNDLADSREVQLEAGESRTFNFTWATGAGDSGTDDMTVSSTPDSQESNDVDTQQVAVIDPASDESQVTVTIDEINSPASGPVTEGELITVDVTVENDGNEFAKQNIVLEDFEGNPVDIAEDVELTPTGEDSVKQLTLQWTTIVGDAAKGDDNNQGTLTVASEDDCEECSAETQAGLEPKTAETRDPVDVMFAIDETGSMALNDEDGEREEALETGIEALDASFGDRAGLLLYSTEFRDFSSNDVLFNYGDYYAPDLKSPVRSDLDLIRDSYFDYSDGGTNISAALSWSEWALDQDQNGNDRNIVLLTDGKQDTYEDGCRNEFGRNPEQCKQIVNETVDTIADDITIYTVAFGDYEDEPLKYAAQEGGTGEGKFFSADNADELEDIFGKIADDVTEPETETFDVQMDPQSYEVDDGEIAELTATVTNSGEADGTQILSLRNPDGTYVATKEVSIEQGASKEVTFEWDTGEYAIDWSENGESVTESLNVSSEDSFVRPEVTVNKGDQPEFRIQEMEFLDQNGDVVERVNERDQVTVRVRVENAGDARDEQDVWLIDGNAETDGSSPLVEQPIAVDLGPDEGEWIEFEWTPEVGTAQTGFTVKAKADTASATKEIDIDAFQDETVPFSIDILSTNGDPDNPLAAGEDTLEVEVDVRNDGSREATKAVFLKADVGGDGTYDETLGVKTVTVAAGEAGQLTFTYDTEIGDQAISDIKVETRDEEDDTTRVSIVAPAGGETDFQLNDIDTNADEAEGEQIIKGSDQFIVDAELGNNGETGSELVILEYDVGGETKRKVTEVDLNAGETNSIDLTDPLFEFSAPVIDDPQEITIRLQGGPSITQAVNIRPPDDTRGVDVQPIDESDIVQSDARERDGAFVAGEETVSVDVTVDNTGSPVNDVYVTLYAKMEGIHGPGDTGILLGIQRIGTLDSETDVTFNWETTVRQGNDDVPWEIYAEARGETSNPPGDRPGVYLDEPESANPGGPAFGDAGTNIGIGIDDIQIS